MFSVIGNGVTGLCVASALTERGLPVELLADSSTPASHWAGGMLAPGCEGESAPSDVVSAGAGAADWWAARVPGVVRRGTLVVVPPRDSAELDRFARMTRGHDAADPGILEPELAGRFARGLYFPEEAHLDPRAAMTALRDRLTAKGVPIRRGEPRGRVIDCRGMAARDMLPDLRGVRGEMLIVEAPELELTRTVRLLHPRFPCYVVPRGQGRYMIGATMVETDDPGPITARAIMELLSAAYALHPGFAEARLVEAGAGLRPAFPDNIPAIREERGRIHVNGMYRHGFLMAPALAEALADRLQMEMRDAS
ncbi:FAD-dependent oxidoreductase [Paracoccus alkanivorans]|uniref:FAD-dependent oxidoreductase n=1 Tax=Paracoccus alkanivorans TaxID=2116655 RepID=A0A3M0MJ21_9RHOB|nr:FAD-dependent oxidoreductase [Paracoccus alkanivorans]RMC37609.1 FAD-dependent oxidoreductase [Paracoccus alkanivorans]